MADTRFYNRSGPFTLTKLVALGQCQINSSVPSEISEDAEFCDVAALDQAHSTHIGVLHNAKYAKSLEACQAGAIITEPGLVDKVPASSIALVSNSPYRTFALIAKAFYPEAFSQATAAPQGGDESVDATAKIGQNCRFEAGVRIGPNAEIGDGVLIAANSVIGSGVVIGDGSMIGANATITHSRIGRQVSIYPGARIGQPGFGFFMDEKGHIPVPQIGRVIIEDGVEIGANTTIDRGSLKDTIIGAGARIDNLVQIAHNVEIGRGCVVVSQVGISGSTKVGDFTAIGGQAGLTGHLMIGKRARIAAQSGVMRDVEDGATIGGSPAVVASQWHRQSVALAKLAKGGK